MGIQTQKSLGVECQVSPTSRGQEEEKEPTDELREVKWVGVELGQWQIGEVGTQHQPLALISGMSWGP
jgi:hypothetical protein